MSTFVLVHGAWHGGWCYARTAKLLRSQGHDVYTPTLSGVGERSHMNGPGINLSLHILDICNVLKYENLSDIVLCGHSYGGLVITGVADAMPDRIKSLVYLDAFVPENGKGLWDYVDDNFKGFFMQTASESGGLCAPVPAAMFNVNVQDAAMVDKMCTPMSLACFMEKSKLTGKGAAVTKRAYIYASNWQGTPFTPFYDAAKADPGWTADAVACGHDVMLDAPADLAGLLVKAA